VGDARGFGASLDQTEDPGAVHVGLRARAGQSRLVVGHDCLAAQKPICFGSAALSMKPARMSPSILQQAGCATMPLTSTRPDTSSANLNASAMSCVRSSRPRISQLRRKVFLSALMSIFF